MNINADISTGRLTKDPELRKVSEELSVCQLRLAVDGMGRGREVGYINVSVFGKAGEAAAEYLSKGWLVAVDGRIEFGQWETEAGEKRHDYTVVGNVEFLTAPVLPRSRSSLPGGRVQASSQEEGAGGSLISQMARTPSGVRAPPDGRLHAMPPGAAAVTG